MQSSLQTAMAAYGFARADTIEGGLINATYLAYDEADTPVAVLQRLHPVFGADVNIDIDVVTAHLASVGMTTPRLVRTTSGDRWVGVGEEVWRAQTYIAGETIHKIDDPTQAQVAGELVGRFHRAVHTLEHDYVFTRAGVHDTAGYLARLRAAVAEASSGDEAADLGRDILAAAERLPDISDVPRRHTHGDLKISNVMFGPNTETAICLVDLDTLGRQTMAYELGDAMRSWCNPKGEDVTASNFNLEILEAAMRGYAAGSDGLLSPDEQASIMPGMRTVCTELAARYCVDAFEDFYFAWDSTRYPTRRAHNIVRARGQLALTRAVAANSDEARAIVASELS
jgi:Ser/Thr protein kinase RdoA (MazF antagonist)